MRKGSTLLVILASFMILCLLGLAGFVTILNRTASPSRIASSAQAADEMESDSASHMAEPNGTVISSTNPFDKNAEEPGHSLIFVGDSRTVGMHDALFQDDSDDACSFIAKSGEGFYWLYHDGIAELEEALRETPGATVIFNLGVNDLREAEQYISFYKELFSVYHDPSFYIMSVNPVVDDKCSGASNAEIEAFNKRMREEFPDKYLDCYNYLLEQGFEAADGLHYSNDTYRMIHHFAVTTLVEDE